TTPVPCEVAFTVAPDTTAPALSETVPEKLPVACPYRSGQTENASEQTATMSSVLFFSITTPFGGRAPNDERPSCVELGGLWTVEGPYKSPLLSKSSLFGSRKILVGGFPLLH